MFWSRMTEKLHIQYKLTTYKKTLCFIHIKALLNASMSLLMQHVLVLHLIWICVILINQSTEHM